MFLFKGLVILHVCILQENVLFVLSSTFILGLVFSDYVVFYGDVINVDWYSTDVVWSTEVCFHAVAAMLSFSV